MRLSSFLGSRLSTAKSVRLCLEVLEDRMAPAVLTVITTSDDVVHTGLSFREAVAQANLDAADGISDTINFSIPTSDSGYDSTTGVATITLAQGQLELNGASATATITIDGGTAGVIVDGNQASRILQVDSGVQAELNHLTLQNGHPLTGANRDQAGGILNNGTLTINDSIVSGNSPSQASPHSYFPGGGGIFNDSAGMLTVSNSTISANSGLYDGGGILNLGTLDLQQGTLVTGNNADYDGGIANYGTLTITQSTISYNIARYAGGIGNYPQTNSDQHTMVIQSSYITHNYASNHVGGIYNDRVPAELSDTVISYNQAAGGNGGGFWTTGANVTMTRCEVSHNTAASHAGGILNNAYVYISYYSDEQILIWADTGTLAMDTCTITANVAGGSGGGVVSADPGESHLWELHRPNDLFPAFTTISNSPLTDNRAEDRGGAIAVFGGTLNLTGCTLTGNSAANTGGAGFIDPAVVKIISSTFAGNSAPLGADLYNLDSDITLIASSIANIFSGGGTITDPFKDLQAQIAALNLNGCQKNSFASTLQAAQQSLLKSNTTAALNQLNAFIKQINALVLSRRLGQLAADSLISEAQGLIDTIA